MLSHALKRSSAPEMPTVRESSSLRPDTEDSAKDSSGESARTLVCRTFLLLQAH